MTNQELYSRVRTHLLTQMEQSIGFTSQHHLESPICLYRGPNGLKCAIGCLIPDSKYDPSMEQASVLSAQVSRAAGIEPADQVSLAMRLQQVHDCNLSGSWEAELDKVADEFGFSK